MQIKTRKNIFAIFVALVLFFAFAFLATFQTTEAVVSNIRQSLSLSHPSLNTDTSSENLNNSPVYEEGNLVDEPTHDTSEIIGEDISKRTETSKTFIQADGTFVWQEYDMPVHYLCDDVYLDIDNTINESFENTSNSFKVRFADDNQQHLVTISDIYGSISMTPIPTESQTKNNITLYAYDGNKNIQSTNNNKGLNKSADTSRSSTEKTQIPEYNSSNLNALNSLNIKKQEVKDNLTETFSKHNSSVVYENLIEGVDFQYIIEGKNLKENIIVNSQLSEYVFRFELNLDNLVPYHSTKGDILITNQAGEAVYTIPKGYMVDAMENYSEEIEYKLESDPYGKYFLMVLADEKFFETATFPVTIDPTIEYTHSKSYMVVGEHHDSTSNYESEFKAHWHKVLGFDTYYYYGYVNFATPESYIANQIAGKTLLSANFTVQFNNTGADFHPMLKSSTAFSMNDPTLYRLHYNQDNSTKILTIDVLRYINENLTNAVISIRDKNKKNSSLTWPKLTIHYADIKNTESITQDMGASGTGVVTLQTGEMNYVYEDISINDGYMPIEVSHIYDESFADTYGVGSGFKLNLQQTLAYENSQFYCYSDAMGKQHYFANEIYFYGDEFGVEPYNKDLGLRLYASGTKMRAIDRTGNSMVFIDGKLSEIHQYPSTHENPKQALMIQITLQSNSNKIASVTNNNTTLYFDYNNNGYLSTIRKGTAALASFGGNTLGNNFFMSYAEKHTDSSLYTTYFGYNSTRLSDIGIETDASYDVTYSYNTEGKINNINYAETATEPERDIALTYKLSKEDDEYALSKGVNTTTILNCDNVYRHVSFCRETVIADYAYQLNGSDMLPLDATSNTFDYFGFLDTFGDTRDAVAINNTFNYIGANETTSTKTRAVTGGTGTYTYALSLWIKRPANTKKDLKLSVKGIGSATVSYEYTFNNDISDWQFGTILMTRRINITSVKLTFSGGPNIEVKDLRVVRLPNTPDSTWSFTPKYNYSTKQLQETYYFNQTTQQRHRCVYAYGSPNPLYPEYPGQLLSVTEYAGNSNTYISRVEYDYDSNYNLTSITNYGLQGGNATSSSQTFDSLGRVTGVTDENGVEVVYTYNADGTVTTKVFGDTNSPDINFTDEYYQGSGLLKSTNIGGTYNSSSQQLVGGITTNFNYTNFGALQTINHNGFNSVFDYDANYNLSGITVAGNQLVDYTYSQAQDTVNYANNQSVNYNYDADGNLSDITNHDDDTIAEFYYNNLHELTYIKQEDIGVSYGYVSNHWLQMCNRGNVTFLYSMQNNNNQLDIDYFAANNAGNATEAEYLLNGQIKETYNYTYNSQELVSSVQNKNSSTTYGYDSFNRLTSKTTAFGNTNFGYAYSYAESQSMATTNMIDATSFTTGYNTKNYGYTYYPNGNLKQILVNNIVVRLYKYDGYDRLISETNYDNYTITLYTYNAGGNITSKTVKDIMTDNTIAYYPYTYSNTWSDQLASFNNQSITYDDVGNPTNYMGTTLTWQNGRELATVGSDISYKYDYQGLRTQKTIDTTTTYYLYEGSTLLAETTGNNYIWYYYDQSGVCGMNYNSTNYVFEKNILGDIIAIWTADGTLVGRYNYDAWGRILNLSSVNGNSILQANPFRYRGYFYDTETDFYYLQSRYYDPAVGRFINADDPTMLFETASTVGGANLYSYCLNNPVMYIDSTGSNPLAIAALVIGIVIDVISVAWSAVDYYNNQTTENSIWLAADMIIPLPIGAMVKFGKFGIKALKGADKVIDIKYATKADFTTEAWNIAKGLDRGSGFTKSTALKGTQIHKGFKINLSRPSFKGGRLDAFDPINKIIYELKPNNPRNIKQGIKQLQRYNDALGGGFTMLLVLY